MKNDLDNLMREVSTCDDRHAFKKIYEQLASPLSRFSAVYVKDVFIADEIVSTVLSRIWIKRKELPTSNIKSYIFKAVKNESLKYLERENKHSFLRIDDTIDIPSVEPTSNTLDPLDALVLKELTDIMEVCIDELPPHCQQVFKLVKNSGLKYKEAAEVLGISINTVENQMSKALKILRREINQYFTDNKVNNTLKIIASIVLFTLFSNFFHFFLE